MAAEGKCVARWMGWWCSERGARAMWWTHRSPGRKKFPGSPGHAGWQVSDRRAQPFVRTLAPVAAPGSISNTKRHYKQQHIRDNLERIGGLSLPEIKPIIGSAQTRFYRNKLDFTLPTARSTGKPAKRQGQPGLGFHVPKNVRQK